MTENFFFIGALNIHKSIVGYINIDYNWLEYPEVNLPPKFSLSCSLIKPILVAKLVTKIIIYHAAVLVINKIDIKKLEVGNLVVDISQTLFVLVHYLTYLHDIDKKWTGLVSYMEAEMSYMNSSSPFSSDALTVPLSSCLEYLVVFYYCTTPLGITQMTFLVTPKLFTFFIHM